MSTFPPLRMLLIATALTALAGCADEPPDDAGPFYRAKLPRSAPHGTLVKFEEVEPLAPDSRSYRVLYTSVALDDSPILVSGLITVPTAAPPAGGFDVVSWAHGTIGLSDACVPSNGYTANHDIYAIADEIVAEGWIAVATDYEGLGPAGVHPYLVGASEARGVLDLVRAAGELEGVTLSGRFAVWGRSQGGHAALFAAEHAATYVPELDLVGTVAAAPASDLSLIASLASSRPSSRGFLWQMFVGMAAAYPELSLDEFLDDAAHDEIDRLLASGACNDEWSDVATAFEGRTVVGFVSDYPDWDARIAQSSPGTVTLPEPVLMIQGTADTVVPEFLTVNLADTMCSLGTTLDFRVFDGQSHNDSTALHMPEIRAFTRDRFAGAAAGSTCPVP